MNVTHTKPHADSMAALSSPNSSESDETAAAVVDIARKAFALDSKPKVVLSNLRFSARKHEFLAILGPSGCGKTTLLRIIAGLDVDYEGRIVVKEQEVRGPSRERALMFQESRLLAWLRVNQNVAFALPTELPKREREARVQNALQLVGLADYARAWPSQLSGGMAKRVALARAIVNLPNLLLLDEPLTALDSPTKYALHDEIARIHATNADMTTILVTHDIDEAVYLSDRILILSPTASHVLREICIPIVRPRDRGVNEFRSLTASVTTSIFELWWKNAPKATD